MGSAPETAEQGKEESPTPPLCCSSPSAHQRRENADPLFKSVIEYFDDNIFCLGSGRVYGYAPNIFTATYIVESIGDRTIGAIERKMQELGLGVLWWDVSPSDYAGRILISLWIKKRGKGEE